MSTPFVWDYRQFDNIDEPARKRFENSNSIDTDVEKKYNNPKIIAFAKKMKVEFDKNPNKFPKMQTSDWE
ncbi:hypothetical protein A3C23_04940 [Candidatus Roizmanbacteria bacterium RIFCSPHIGHO2_02_FULL_37_13b]|uniref:Uncharacterized protein n=1 Tax=Candidatus Roizmanbacteria bacterium RIFCSPLOWO2_02_FULL_36_11 TaxID=1802071 RepID=A0A1F7JCT6_9BACT|nr:MAG: hypothetical protein A3C23_04940 [Candidatus Roizmanbacteria bacterium RIFCSPHIGHO2_02_FULL_37_13b]OGK53430.1 MAG: hypothetical protein A3H78_02755 [Candidatus Roizmanbacteria bacterium RIFCSPLOWO2_02_FULL_36_11]